MSSLPIYACRMCGATSYRRVIDRDATGQMRPTGLYRCSGCSVVFADPKQWRDGGPDGPAPPVWKPKPLTAPGAVVPAPRPPDLRTYSSTVPVAVTTQAATVPQEDDRP